MVKSNLRSQVYTAQFPDPPEQGDGAKGLAKVSGRNLLSLVAIPPLLRPTEYWQVPPGTRVKKMPPQSTAFAARLRLINRNIG